MLYIFYLDGYFIMLLSLITKFLKIYCLMNINEKIVFYVWEKVGKRIMFKKFIFLYVIFNFIEMSFSF